MAFQVELFGADPPGSHTLELALRQYQNVRLVVPCRLRQAGNQRRGSHAKEALASFRNLRLGLEKRRPVAEAKVSRVALEQCLHSFLILTSPTTTSRLLSWMPINYIRQVIASHHGPTTTQAPYAAYTLTASGTRTICHRCRSSYQRFSLRT
jgi:hypothetical protein